MCVRLYGCRFESICVCEYLILSIQLEIYPFYRTYWQTGSSDELMMLAPNGHHQKAAKIITIRIIVISAIIRIMQIDRADGRTDKWTYRKKLDLA